MSSPDFFFLAQDDNLSDLCCCCCCFYQLNTVCIILAMQCCSPWQSLNDLVCIELANNAEWNKASYILKHVHRRTTSCNTQLLHLWLILWKIGNMEITLQTTLLEVGLSSAEVVSQQNPLELMKHYFELLRWIINELWSSQINLKQFRKTYFSTAYCADTILCTQLGTNLIIRMSVGWTTACRLVDYIYLKKKNLTVHLHHLEALS